MFDFKDEIQFCKAVVHSFKPIPLPAVFKDGTGGMGSFAPERFYVELYDSEGNCGHATCSESFASKVLPKILNGEKLSYNDWRSKLYWGIRNTGFQSEAAVDVGLLDLLMLDLLAQRHQKPLHRFLGATKNWAATYKGGGSLLLSDSELVEDMARYVDEGYTTVKFKVAGTEADLVRIQKVRAALGKSIQIAIDANQCLSVEQAYEFALLAAPYDIAWFEEPIHSQDMNGIKALKDMGCPMPLAFGESMRISYAFETYVEKGVAHLQPSVGRMTRMDDLFRIQQIAHENGVKFSSGGRIYLNASFGCCYDENDYIEYHEPITKPVGEYTLNQPQERGGRFWCDDTTPGIAQRINIAKLEKDNLYLGQRVYYTE